MLNKIGRFVAFPEYINFNKKEDIYVFNIILNKKESKKYNNNILLWIDSSYLDILFKVYLEVILEG